MISFLIGLAFTPALVGLAWMYVSPTPRLDRCLPVKVIIKTALCVALLGGMLAQLNYLAHHVPSSARGPYVCALLLIDAISTVSTAIHRNPSLFKLKSPNRTEDKKNLEAVGVAEAGPTATKGAVQPLARDTRRGIKVLWIGLGASSLMLFGAVGYARQVQYRMPVYATAGIFTGFLLALGRAYGGGNRKDH
jgi:hypothetical protein